MPTVSATLRHCEMQLKSYSGSPRLDAELLVAKGLGCTRTYLYAHPEGWVKPSVVAAIDALMLRRSAGESIAYLSGNREFWSLRFNVGKGVLVPRPETERLVECILWQVRERPFPKIADLGTGAGPIAIAVAKSRPDATVIATDDDRCCIAWARRNAKRIKVPNVLVVHGNWCDPLGANNFDVLATNPPYLAANDPHLDTDGVRCEPRTALVAGFDGLAAIRQIIRKAPVHLVAAGALILEHGADQGTAVRRLLKQQGFAMIRTVRDLAGLDRISIGVLA